MQKNAFETVLGAIVILTAAMFLIFASRIADIGPKSGGYSLSARFSKVDGIEAGAPVRISGINVGQVTSFSLDPETYAAIVTMNIRNDIKLPADTAAVISSAGLLDGKFMSLEPGADDAMLESGGEIAYTQSTPSLEQLLGQVIFALTDNKGGAQDGPVQQTVPEMP